MPCDSLLVIPTRTNREQHGMSKATIQQLASAMSRLETKLDQLLRDQRKDAVADGREWLTVDEAAEICRYRPWTLRQACKTGRVESIDASGVRKLADGSWRIRWDVAESIRDNGLPAVGR